MLVLFMRVCQIQATLVDDNLLTTLLNDLMKTLCFEIQIALPLFTGKRKKIKVRKKRKKLEGWRKRQMLTWLNLWTCWRMTMMEKVWLDMLVDYMFTRTSVWGLWSGSWLDVIEMSSQKKDVIEIIELVTWLWIISSAFGDKYWVAPILNTMEWKSLVLGSLNICEDTQKHMLRGYIRWRIDY